jgi:hypothetical protein
MALEYPCIVSTIGDIILFQSLTFDGITYVYTLPEDEIFLSFVQYFHRTQLGFVIKDTITRKLTKEKEQ